MLLAELARDRQWSSSDIKKLAGANLVRVFREVEKVCGCQTGKA
jgi:microsomal dipeptidase-like Zn-dependent dipeptidase